MRGDEPAIPRSAVRMECLSCRYSLVGLERGECPECGRGFDPGDARTFGPKRRQYFVIPLIWLGRIYAVGLTALVTYLLLSLACPSFTIHAIVYAVFGLAAMTVPSGVVALAALFSHRVRWPGTSILHRRNWAPGVIAIAVLAFFVMQLTGAVWTMQWASTRAAVDEVASGKRGLVAHRWYGLTKVRNVDRLADGTIVLNLGWPADWSGPPPQLRLGPSAGPDATYPFGRALDDGWWIVWSDT